MLRGLGAEVIDADQVARQVVEPTEPAYRDIVSWFGRETLLPNGRIDRPRLASIIFADDHARQKLNAITHPRVIARMDQLADSLVEQGYSLPVVFDIPLLIESNLQHTVDEIWLVAADDETQLRRLMARNQLDRAAALTRIHAQLPLVAKAKWAAEIIDNNGSLEQTRLQVQRSWGEAQSRSKHSNG